jgi:glycosyltransferase involved in cell wall biosynthesis
LRDGIGLIFSEHPIKGPEVAVPLIRTLSERFAHVPRRAFGGDRRWRSLAPCDYTRYPSIPKAREIYNRCKIWLVTSKDEGFCLPILEAMACGCAVISSNHMNAAEMINDGVNGFTVPYGDIEAYLNRIGQLLTDESLRQRFVAAAPANVQRFTWKEAANRMEESLISFASAS